jgi:hypothetical protein
MLNRYRNKQLNSFTAEVFMCQYYNTASGLGYWNLRLLCGGTMIDAFQWDKAGWPVMEYKANDEVLVGGRWTTKAKTRFQVIRSTIVMRVAANDPIYTSRKQLELDFG